MIPKREVATNNGQTYFVTSNTAERRPFFRHERWAKLFLETLYGYRPDRYLIHAFVLMPDHFHLLITPRASLELAIQCLKGGFSLRAKREFKWIDGIWVTGYSDHRIRDDEDFEIHRRYIASNPVKARLVESPEQYLYSSANGSFEVDAFPRGLKPQVPSLASIGAAKAAPFQNIGCDSVHSETAPFQDIGYDSVHSEAAPFQNIGCDSVHSEAAPFQSDNNRAQSRRDHAMGAMNDGDIA